MANEVITIENLQEFKTKYDVKVNSIAEDVLDEVEDREEADTALGQRIDSKQDTLVSGTSIKTINNESLLGAGNIVISGKTYEGQNGVVVDNDLNKVGLDTGTFEALENIESTKLLVAGDGIALTDGEDGLVISSTSQGTTYTAGDNISISDDHVISVTGTVPNAAKISTKGPYRDKVISYVSDDKDEYELINLSVNGMFIGPYGSDNDEGSVKLVTGTNKADVVINRTGGTNSISLYNTYTAIAGKQDTISDLATIRSGASAGATAVQPDAISDMATETWVGEQGFAKSSEIPSVDGLMAESNLSTSEIGNYNGYNGYYFDAQNAINADYATNAENDASGQNIVSTYATKDELLDKQDKLTATVDIKIAASEEEAQSHTSDNILYLVAEA